MTVRPAVLPPSVTEKGRHAVHGDSGGQEGLFPILRQARQSGAPRERTLALVEEFSRGDRYVRTLSNLPLDIAQLMRWMLDSAKTALNTMNVAEAIRTLTGQALPTLVASAEFQLTAQRLFETVAADALLNRPRKGRGDDLTTALKLIHFMRLAADSPEALSTNEPLGSVISRMVVVVPDSVRVNLVDPSPAEPPPAPVDPPQADDSKMRGRLDELIAARRELLLTTGEDDALEAERREAPPVPQPPPPGPRGDGRAEGRSPERIGLTGAVRLKAQVGNRLRAGTQAVIRDMRLDPGQLNPFSAIRAIEAEIHELSGKLSAPAGGEALRLGGATLDLRTLKNTLGYYGTAKPGSFPATVPCSFAAGVGDLLIVRQKLKAYELGDFAHVENVLAGEVRERKHRRLNVREEVTEIETEEETERERDLQSTERNELQTEAEKTVKSDFALDSGLQVSGSYGPAVSFTASLNASYSTSTEEAQRKSTTYSREVIDRSAERTKQRTRELRRRRLLEEVEEHNLHRVENTTPPRSHIRGIYRWLNKLYDAQIFNYGQRMMYEFTVPEPAAFLLYALIENPPKNLELVKPEPPRYGSGPLRPANLSLSNYQDYVARYGVTNAPPPPSAFTVASVFDKQDGHEENNFGRASKVTVPDGYEAYATVVSTDFVFTQGTPPGYRVMLGDVLEDRSNVAGAMFRLFPRRFRGELSVSYQLMNVRSFALGVDVFCSLTTEGFAKWQQGMYDAIMEAYQRQQADYEEKVAAASISDGVKILGRNPLENARLIRDELKKLVIMFLTNSPYININDFYSSAEPVMNLSKACKDGKRIRFFENAFEWHNILYVLYAYFWGRHARWISAIHFTDPDPDFAAFLRAGAARVQVPVRPGFEKAVAHFCQFGDIWDGNDPPLINDDLYVPIIDEISENLGKLDEGVPYPPGTSKPWEVRLPTDLVVLQDLREIKTIHDVMTGQPVDLG